MGLVRNERVRESAVFSDLGVFFFFLEVALGLMSIGQSLGLSVRRSVRTREFNLYCLVPEPGALLAMCILLLVLF